MRPLCVHSESQDWSCPPRDCVAVSFAERFYFRSQSGRRARANDSTRSRNTIHVACPLVTCPRRAHQATRLTRLLRSPVPRPPLLASASPCQRAAPYWMAGLCESRLATAGGGEHGGSTFLSSPVNQHTGFPGYFVADVPSRRVLSDRRVRCQPGSGGPIRTFELMLRQFTRRPPAWS